jgi:hypothetical protein
MKNQIHIQSNVHSSSIKPGCITSLGALLAGSLLLGACADTTVSMPEAPEPQYELPQSLVIDLSDIEQIDALRFTAGSGSSYEVFEVPFEDDAVAFALNAFQLQGEVTVSWEALYGGEVATAGASGPVLTGYDSNSELVFFGNSREAQDLSDAAGPVFDVIEEEEAYFISQAVVEADVSSPVLEADAQSDAQHAEWRAHRTMARIQRSTSSDNTLNTQPRVMLIPEVTVTKVDNSDAQRPSNTSATSGSDSITPNNSFSVAICLCEQRQDDGNSGFEQICYGRSDNICSTCCTSTGFTDGRQISVIDESEMPENLAPQSL